MANKRITEVDYIDSLNSNESFFINHNNSIKQINKSDIVFEISNGGTGATTPAEALENLGITVTAEELNNIQSQFNNVQSQFDNIQLQLDDKSNVNHEHNASDIVDGVLPIENGGTGSSDGASAIQNLFAAGNTILSPYQFGDELPEAGVVGRVFYKKHKTA